MIYVLLRNVLVVLFAVAAVGALSPAKAASPEVSTPVASHR